MIRVGITACALVLLAVTSVAAQHVVTGTVVRVDPGAHVIVLDNGQMYQATPQSVFLVNNQPMMFTAIAPGMPVVVQYAQPVVYQNGHYVVVSQAAPAATVVTVPPATAPVPVAGMYEVSGVVKYSDSVRRIIRFEDGRNISIDENVQLLANGSPVMLSTVRPGTFVVARSSRPLAFRNNTYYVVTPSAAPAAVVTTPVPVVATTPTVVMAPPAQVISGTVVRFDHPNYIVLSDGRVVPATAQTVVMVDNRPMPYTMLQPGTRVVIYPQGPTAVVTDPYAFPAAAYPEAGLRDKELERNAP